MHGSLDYNLSKSSYRNAVTTLICTVVLHSYLIYSWPYAYIAMPLDRDFSIIRGVANKALISTTKRVIDLKHERGLAYGGAYQPFIKLDFYKKIQGFPKSGHKFPTLYLKLWWPRRAIHLCKFSELHFVNLQIFNFALLQTCILSIRHFCKLAAYQFASNSKGCTVRSSENYDVYAQEMNII